MKATNNENIIIGSSSSNSSSSNSSNNNIKSSFYRVLKSQQSSSAGKTTTRDPTTATKSKKTTTTSSKVDRNNNTSCKRANNTSNNKIGNVIIKRLSGNFEVEKQEDEDYDEDDEEEYDDDVEFHDFTISTTNNSKKNTTTAAADVATTTTTTTTTKRNNSLSSHKTNYNSKNNNNNNSKKSHNISALNSEVKRRFDYEKFTSLPVRILEQEVSVSASANNESTSITNTNNNQVDTQRKDCVKLEDMNSYKFKLYSLEPFDREIFRIQDIRDNIQKRTFTKWMNQHLKHKGLCVNDLYEDLKDGTKLIALLEQLTNRTLIKQKGHMKLHSLENIQTCLDFLKQHRIKLINIHKEEIVNGNPKLTLGLIWIIILYFQIMNFANYIPSDYHIYDFKISPEELLNNKDEMNAKQSLLQWCQENLRGYESVRCKDFSTSWRDGRVLCAILNRHRPDKISFTESFQRSNVDNLRLCFDIAEFEFGVPKIIEPEDMDVDHPDDRSIMTYVSMLFNAMPNIPPHPSEVKLESYKRALLEEYAIICRSLMRWLRDSISTMDNRNVPNNIIEIKSLLNDVKSFRLEEYATRLKEKKKLLNLYDEIMNLPDSENFNVENEIKSIEKVWHKFDNYIQLRENLLEKTYKKYENLQLLIQKIDKLYENCEKQLNQIEEDFNEIAKQLPTMNQVQTNSCNDRFEDQIKQCDHDLRRMFIECQHLKDEEHNEAEYYHKKINQLQNRSLELKSHILNEINSSKTKRLNGHHHSTNNLNGGDPAKSSLNNIYNWIENKKKAIQNQTYPSELNVIKEEIVQTEIDLSDIEKFREKYSKELLKENDQNESAKYSVNELEIAYNLLYNMANCKLKCLKQLEELIKLVNDQLYRLDQIEEIELTRDWSSPHKLSYSSLQAHKNTLDEDLKLISINHIDPINSYGRLLITDNHPATNHIKTYLETVNQHLEWVKQLSYLLGVHLRNFGELENFNNEHGKLSEKIESIKSNLSTILSDESKNSVESIEKMGNLRRELDLVRAECEDLLNKSHRLVPFTMRRLKLKSPYNRCKCLIPYKKSTLNIHKDEECIIDDNTQRIKWKVRTHDGQTGLVPSVCFQLPPIDEDSVDLAQQLKTKCENLSKQAHSCQTQLRKDRLFDMMNVIKFCELDEFEERKKTSIDIRVEEDQADIESLLKRIRVEMEELQRDAPSSSQDNHYQTSDMRMLIDTYEKCNRRVNELNEKSLMRDEYTKMERDLEANLDGLEMRLSYLRNERLAQLKARPANSSLSFSSNLDKLIFLYQEFERNDLKSFENEIENTYKRIEVVENASYRHHHHRHNSTSTPNGTSSSINTLRQRLDNLQMEANALRNETNTNVQNINMVKVLIGLLENADKWLTKTEEKLANQELLTTIFQFPTTINRILYELEEVESSLKQRQDDINKIRAVSDKIEVIRMPLSAEIANIDELLEASEESKQRYKALFAQIADRVMLAREVQEAYDTYETQHKRETKWVKLLRKQCDDYELKQHLVRQQKFDLRRKYNQPQSHSQQQYEAVIEDDLNDLKSNLDTNLKFNQLLIDYRRGTTQSSLTIVEPLKINDDEVLNQLRHELNSLNREYSNFLNDYNQKLKQLASSISEKSSSTPNNKQFLSTVQILINQQEKQHENVEPLISRYTQDVFDRYDLSNNNINSKYSSSSNYTNLINTSTTLQQQERHQQSQQTPVTTEYHYYYTDNDSTTIDENDPPTAAFFSTTTTSTSSPSSCTTNSSQPPVKAATSTATTITNMHPNDLLSIVEYPLSFYDAVNQCQLDLVTGCLKPNNTFLADAIRLNLLDPKSAYIVTPASPNPIDLSEAVRKGIITSSNKVYVGPGVHLSLSDALKQGYLKLESGRNLTTSCSVSSETQSMSVKSIRDPSTGELLAPTEAINRKLLDPYKGLFVNSQTGEQMPISEAIHKGFIVVEMISPSKTSTKKDSNFTSSSAAATATDENSNVVSTSLVRETKSYHLLAVFDPTKNDEITIKEAINRGILDRKRGVYVHPLTNESFSISDAINKGLIRARVITPPSTLGSPHQHHLVSSNRFEENRSYTITAAIDPRTHKPIGLSQAMRDGIIDAKNGTYVNIVTGEAISINKAIELKLVLTGAATDDSSSSSSTSPRNKSTRATATTTKSSRPSSVSSSSAHERHKSPRREVTTLNVEAVRDVRTGRMVSVSEAMQLGLLDRNTLNYCNPITQEVLTLSRAHERGYIQGHYSDATTTTSNLTTTTTTRSSVNEESYFIIDIFDPRINKSLTLDQAISSGLFDHSRGVYIHPLTNEQISLGDAVRKGLIQAQSFSPSPPTQPSNGEQQNRYDPRLPVGAFGIDKQIKSMRTKFNRDGTSVLQIDIESTRPSRGVYEVDEIEEFTVNEKLVNDHHDADQVVRKVVDINSVHRVDNPNKPPEPQLINLSHDHSSSSSLHHASVINNLVHEKNILKVEVNKELGADLKIQRFEDVVDDDHFYRRPNGAQSNGVGVVRINVDSNNNTSVIPERKTFDAEHQQRVQTLVIDDANPDKYSRRAVNIEGQNYVHKNEVQINDKQRRDDLFDVTQRSVEELNRKIELIRQERANQVKVKTAEVVDTRVVSNERKNLDLDDQRHTIERNVKVTVDIKGDDRPKAPRPVQTIVDETTSQSHRVVYEDSFKVDSKPPKTTEDDDESFEEWTEVYTITVRGIRYKIIWVYDALKNERVTLSEAIERGIIDLKKSTYHNLKTSYSSTLNEAVDDGLIGIEEDNTALILKVNGITYTIYWLWDPVKRKRVSPKRAIERGILDLEKLVYRNYQSGECISVHEAVYMKLIGASDDLSSIEEELVLKIDGVEYKIAWVKDSRSGEKYKPRDALRHGLLDLTNYFYNKYDTNESLTIPVAIDQNWIGLSEMNRNESQTSTTDSDSESSTTATSTRRGLNRQDSLLSLDDEELTIKTKTAIYVITGLLHPETQKEIKVSEAIRLGILAPDTGAYKDFKTNVVYEVGEAINEGIVFATVTDLLQDEQASTEFLREEIKRFIVKSVVDPRTHEKIGGLQAQAAGILNYAQGVYTNPDTSENIPISEAIARNYIQVQLQEETAHEEFDAEVVTETLMERRVTNYRILGVLDPFSNELISASEAVHRQIIDTETNAYVDASVRDASVPIKEAVRRNLIQAEVSESIERKPLGLTLQNAIRLGLYVPDTGKFKDLYSNRYFDLNQAIEKGHINPNGAALADSSSGSMTLNEAFSYSIISKRTGILDRQRLNMFKGKIVEGKIYKWNFEDAVKCGIVSLKTGRYKHQQTGESLSIRDAINRGLIDGETTIIECPSGELMALRSALDSAVNIDDNGNIVSNGQTVTSLEQAFNSRKIFSAFDENTGEIFLPSLGKIVPFEKAIRRKKMDKSVKIFDPKSNRDLTVNDAIERAIIDKTSGMIIDPKGCGGLLSIKEAVKRGIVSVAGAPVVTGHHNSETIEAPTITSRKLRHHPPQRFDDVTGSLPIVKSRNSRHHHHRDEKLKSSSSSRISANSQTNGSNLKSKSYSKTPIIYDAEYLQSDLLKDVDPTVKATYKTTNEEHRKKISGNDVTELLKSDYKETLLEPGEKPKVTASANYQKQTNSKLDDSTAATTTTN